MWEAKILKVIEEEDGSQELAIVCLMENQSLRNIYKAAMWECKDQKCALAAIYRDVSMDDVYGDDPTKRETKSVYQINKGALGGILLFGRNHNKRLLHIRENRTA